jgi:hypothetical protein
MTPRDAAIRHVVDRCPSCGVEHEVRTHACEACDTPLRPWCRVHGREIDWMDGAACPRCAEDAALGRTPAAAAPARSPARTRPPRKRPGRAGRKPSTRATPPPSPPRPSRRMKRTAVALPVDDRAGSDQRSIRALAPALLVVAGGATAGLLIAWQTPMTEQQLRLLGGLVVAFVFLVACVRCADEW